MCEDMRALLNAYLDGELQGWRLLGVQAHLASCKACREHLKELRLVSDLLHAAPLPEFTPAARFLPQLALQLPRRPLAAQLKRGPTLVWWLAPIGLLGLWFFVQTLITISGAVALLAQSGLLEKGTAWLSTAPQHTAWFTTGMSLFGGQIGTSWQAALSTFDKVSLFGGNLLNQYLWQAVIALLYWFWLAAWWLRTRGRLVLGAAARSKAWN